MTASTPFTKSITASFEVTGKNRKHLVGFVGELRDESGTVLSAQLYDTQPEAEQALNDLTRELLLDYAERGLVDTVPVALLDPPDGPPAVGDEEGDEPPEWRTEVAIGMRFEHLGFGKGTVINITDDEYLNVQVNFDRPSRFGSKFWFDRSEVIRPRAQTLQSIAIEAKLATCGYCAGIHHVQACPELHHALHTERWIGADLGRGLCQMLWRNHAGFVALLLEATPGRLVEYALSYQAFIRANKPDSDLTVNDVLVSWRRAMGGDRGPAAPALRVAA